MAKKIDYFAMNKEVSKHLSLYVNYIVNAKTISIKHSNDIKSFENSVKFWKERIEEITGKANKKELLEVVEGLRKAEKSLENATLARDTEIAKKALFEETDFYKELKATEKELQKVKALTLNALTIKLSALMSRYGLELKGTNFPKIVEIACVYKSSCKKLVKSSGKEILALSIPTTLNNVILTIWENAVKVGKIKPVDIPPELTEFYNKKKAEKKTK